MRNFLALASAALSLTSCGTVIRVPDSIFAPKPKNRVVIGTPAPGSPTPQRAHPPQDAPRRPPVGIRIPGRPGFVYSPYVRGKMVDVRDLPSGIVVRDPYTGQPITVP